MSEQNPQRIPVADEAALAQEFNSTSGSRNKPEHLEWLKDAGLGLFVHWSADVQLGGVISHTLVGASDDYVDRYFNELPETFCPDRWDADRLARLAKVAGVQYMVFTTKHHSGFCMWHTASTSFSIKNTPYGKDIVAQYVAACRKYGLKVGFYFSPEDFRFLYTHGMPITRTPTEPYEPDVMDQYRTYIAHQMTELMTLFGPIDLIFFDGGELMKDENGQSLQELCKHIAWELQPDILVTRGAIPTPEQTLPGVGSSEVWEACVTLATAWGYQPTNERIKPGKQVIEMLMRTRAMGGALLLNVGPDSDGCLSAEQEGLVRELGLWCFINREAVVNTRPWIIVQEGKTILLADKTGTTLYAVLAGETDWKLGTRREIVIKSARASENSVASVLGASGETVEYRPELDAACHISMQEDGLHVSVMNAQRIYCGSQWPNPLVLRITNVEPAFNPMGVHTGDAVQTGADSALLHADVVSLGSFPQANVRMRWRVFPGFSEAVSEGGWQDSEPTPVSAAGAATVQLTGLERGVTYEYAAVIENEMNRMQGEKRLFMPE